VKKKTLCEIVKKGQLKDKTKKYLNKVSEPKYICMECGRVANKKSVLCSPAKWSDFQNTKE